MDLTGWFLRAATARPRVLLATPAGGTGARLAVEQQLRSRSWATAASPAEADILVVCGQPGPQFAAAVRRVWAQLPVPKAWASVTAAPDAATALAGARRTLADRGAQAAVRDAPELMEGHPAAAEQAGGHGEMSLPGGLGMAERGPDRDGLALDQLHIALGPVLPDWPAGLLLRLTVQGDVVQHAEAEWSDAGAPVDSAYWDEPWRRAAAGEPVPCARAARWVVARYLDSVGRLAAVAGWDGAAGSGRLLRDQALAGAPADTLAARLRRFRRRVGGSWLLRWMTRDLGRLEPAAAAAYGFPATVGDSDVWQRTGWWLARIEAAAERLADPTPLSGADEVLARPQGGVDSAAAGPVLAGAVVGTELAATRLIVASVDPDLERTSVAREAGDG